MALWWVVVNPEPETLEGLVVLAADVQVLQSGHKVVLCVHGVRLPLLALGIKASGGSWLPALVVVPQQLTIVVNLHLKRCQVAFARAINILTIQKVDVPIRVGEISRPSEVVCPRVGDGVCGQLPLEVGALVAVAELPVVEALELEPAEKLHRGALEWGIGQVGDSRQALRVHDEVGC